MEVLNFIVKRDGHLKFEDESGQTQQNSEFSWRRGHFEDEKMTVLYFSGDAVKLVLPKPMTGSSSLGRSLYKGRFFYTLAYYTLIPVLPRTVSMTRVLRHCDLEYRR
ncbi:hypothetical protein AVEN_80715-1 [Araneus ventricosus]|uniref:Uncharacterized protein n=1 Tax=Araneus ventricosus TaxID=182803 RepID=A0A4Y2H1E5_ARAVE|nr:hypothetical protein AVEN_80715-1 [Araneus ventricosus]